MRVAQLLGRGRVDGGTHCTRGVDAQAGERGAQLAGLQRDEGGGRGLRYIEEAAPPAAPTASALFGVRLCKLPVPAPAANT